MAVVKEKSDQELLYSLKCNSQSAFTSIYNLYSDYVYITARKMLDDEDACFDIVQDIFEWLWINRDSVEIRSLKSYLTSAARFKVLNHIKKGRFTEQFISALSGVPEDSQQIDLAYEVKELQEIIKQFTSTLPDQAKFVAFLDKLKGYINGTTSTGYNNNWYTSAGYALIAIGVFEDNRDVYNSGVTIIKNVIPQEMNSTGYMSGEVCVNHQDYTHYQYALTGISYAANICGIQGDLSIYTATSSQLLAGYNWKSGLMQGTLTAAYSPSGSSTSPIWPGIFVANRHYNTAATNYIASHYSTNSNGLPGGDLGFLNWTEFAHYNVPTYVN